MLDPPTEHWATDWDGDRWAPYSTPTVFKIWDLTTEYVK